MSSSYLGRTAQGPDLDGERIVGADMLQVPTGIKSVEDCFSGRIFV